MKPEAPEAAALLARYRQEHALPDAVRARARAALAQRIAAGAARNAPDVAWPVPTAPRTLRRIWWGAGTAGLVALIGLGALRSAPPAPRSERAAAPATIQPAATEATTATSAQPRTRPHPAEPVSPPAGRAQIDGGAQPRDVRIAIASSSNVRAPRSARRPISLGASDAPRATTPDPVTPAVQADTRVPTSAEDVNDLAVVTQTTPPDAPELARTAPDQPRHESLDVEVQLLRDAHDKLSAGQPLNALSVLTEHARRFPNGQLRDMREVSRVIALCELGRVAEARERAQRFLREQPRSHYAARLRESCASERE